MKLFVMKKSKSELIVTRVPLWLYAVQRVGEDMLEGDDLTRPDCKHFVLRLL